MSSSGGGTGTPPIVNPSNNCVINGCNLIPGALKAALEIPGLVNNCCPSLFNAEYGGAFVQANTPTVLGVGQWAYRLCSFTYGHPDGTGCTIAPGYPGAGINIFRHGPIDLVYGVRTHTSGDPVEHALWPEFTPSTSQVIGVTYGYGLALEEAPWQPFAEPIDNCLGSWNVPKNNNAAPCASLFPNNVTVV